MKITKFSISVVIPTYNRISSLMTCLNYLDNQSFNDGFEVIVVDDGSTDDTLNRLKGFKPNNFSLKVISQKNQKQGIARNNGVQNSSGELIIFIQDDIWASSSFISEHYNFHLKNSEEFFVAIGNTKWTLELQKDDLHKFLDGSSGSIFPSPLFDYRSLKNLSETDFMHFYTNNLSIKKSFFLREKFNSNFNSYGWEDIELGYRLFKSGMKIYFLENAIAYHNHTYTLSNFAEREFCVGKNLNLLLTIQPAIKAYFKRYFLKKILFKMLTIKPFLYIYSKLNKNLYFYFYGKKFYFHYTKL